MGNPLRDQLKKAKLLSKKDAKRLAHEARVERTQVGREGLEQAAADRKRELEALQGERRAKDREQQAAVEAQRSAAAERSACVDLLRREAVVPRGRGMGARWFFETVDGFVPSLSVDGAVKVQLESKQLWIVRVSERAMHEYGVMSAEHAQRVAKVMPERVVWPHSGPAQE